MSDDLSTNTKMYNVTYTTINKVNMVTDSYYESIVSGMKDITNILYNNIVCRMNIFRNDNDIDIKDNYFEYLQHDPIKSPIRQKKFKVTRFKTSQKMSFKHGSVTNDSIKDIYEVLPNSYNPKSGDHKSRLNLAKFLSKKYAKNEYVYLEYFFNKLSRSASKLSSKKFEITNWAIHDVTYQEYMYLLNSLLEYDRLQAEMYKSYTDLVQTKADLSALECVIRYKECERQLTEYTNELEDTNKRLEHYQKIDNDEYNNMSLFKPHKKEHHIKRIANKSNYQERLQSTLKELIRYCTETLEVRKYKMESNHNYIALNERLAFQKETYTLAQKKVRNYRRKFLKYKVSPKSAIWRYDNHFGAIQWFKVSDIKYLKMYDKVTFDYDKVELKLH